MAKKLCLLYSELTGTMAVEELTKTKNGYEYVGEKDINGKTMYVNFDRTDDGLYSGVAQIGKEVDSVDTFKIIDTSTPLSDNYTLENLVTSNSKASGIADGFVEFATKTTAEKTGNEGYCKNLDELQDYLLARTKYSVDNVAGLKSDDASRKIYNDIIGKFSGYKSSIEKIDDTTKYDKKNPTGKADRVLSEVMTTSKKEDTFGSLSSMLGIYNILEENEEMTFEEAKEKYIDNVETMDYTSKYFDQSITANNQVDALNAQYDSANSPERKLGAGIFGFGVSAIVGAIALTINPIVAIGAIGMGVSSLVKGIRGNVSKFKEAKAEAIKKAATEKNELKLLNSERNSALDSFKSDLKDFNKSRDIEAKGSALERARNDLGVALRVTNPNSDLGKALISERLSVLALNNKDWEKIQSKYNNMVDTYESLNPTNQVEIGSDDSENSTDNDNSLGAESQNPDSENPTEQNPEELGTEINPDDEDSSEDSTEETENQEENASVLEEPSENADNGVDVSDYNLNEDGTMVLPDDAEEHLITDENKYANVEDFVENDNTSDTSVPSKEDALLAEIAFLKNKIASLEEEIATLKENNTEKDKNEEVATTKEPTKNDLKDTIDKVGVGKAISSFSKMHTEIGNFEKRLPTSNCEINGMTGYSIEDNGSTFERQYDMANDKTTYSINGGEPITINGSIDGHSPIWKSMGTNNEYSLEYLGASLVIQNALVESTGDSKLEVFKNGSVNPEVLKDEKTKDDLMTIINEIKDDIASDSQASEMIEKLENALQNNDDSVEKENSFEKENIDEDNSYETDDLSNDMSIDNLNNDSLPDINDNDNFDGAVEDF